MRVFELYEASSEELLPPKIRSMLLGKAAALAAQEVREEYNSIRAIRVEGMGDMVWVTFAIYPGPRLPVVSMFKKALKTVGLSSYSYFDTENTGAYRDYSFQFEDFAWAEYDANKFVEGWKQVPHTHWHLGIDAGKGAKFRIE